MSTAFYQYLHHFLEDPTYKVTIQWIPGYKRYQINEKADQATKKGCRLHRDLFSDIISYHVDKCSRLIQKA